MKFAQWVFRIAGIYGILALAPLYFSESRIGHDFPPAVTHPEFFYGFTGVALAWQILFLLLARDPARYRMMMIPAILEKATYGLAVIVLFFQNRVPVLVLVTASIDIVLGALFLVAFVKTRPVTFAPASRHGGSLAHG